MGIFSFIKKILKEPETAEPPKEKITLFNIEEFTKKELEKTIEKEKKVLSIINEKIKVFTSELKENARVVKEVDIEPKEKNDKIKSAVYEGRKKYLEFLERFINNLHDSFNPEDSNLEKTIDEINSAFLRFNENSGKSYERATILIGKEMGSIRETIRKFSSELLSIFNENKEMVSTIKRFSLIQEKLNENKNLNEKCTKGDEKILLLNKKIQDKEKENKSLSEEVEKIKKSPEYIENINKISSVESGEKEIEKEISELRQLIDFKALSNFFHIFEDRMTIVKLYRDNFIEEFKKDKGSRLLNLLNESKLNTETIYDKIKKIQDRGEEIENDKKEIKKDETHPLALEIERAKEEISNIINEKEWAEKNKEKIKSQVDENIIAVKEQLGFMKLNLED